MTALSARNFLPGACIAMLTLFSALPWGLPAQSRFLLPLLPFAAIHYWTVRRPAATPEWLVFLSGLAIDVLTYGPLGFWSLVFLVGYMLARMLPQSPSPRVVPDWLHFCATLVLLTAGQWLIASAYFLGPVDWRPLVRGATLAGLLYPIVAAILHPIDSIWTRPTSPRFERG